MNQYWSWILTAVGVTGLYIAGRRNWVGWGVGLGAQFLWIAYAIATRQWGFLVSAFAYGSVYAKNLRSWRRAARAEALEHDEATDRRQIGRALAYALVTVVHPAIWLADLFAGIRPRARLRTAYREVRRMFS